MNAQLNDVSDLLPPEKGDLIFFTCLLNSLLHHHEYLLQFVLLAFR